MTVYEVPVTLTGRAAWAAAAGVCQLLFSHPPVGLCNCRACTNYMNEPSFRALMAVEDAMVCWLVISCSQARNGGTSSLAGGVGHQPLTLGAFQWPVACFTLSADSHPLLLVLASRTARTTPSPPWGVRMLTSLHLQNNDEVSSYSSNAPAAAVTGGSPHTQLLLLFEKSRTEWPRVLSSSAPLSIIKQWGT